MLGWLWSAFRCLTSLGNRKASGNAVAGELGTRECPEPAQSSGDPLTFGNGSCDGSHVQHCLTTQEAPPVSSADGEAPRDIAADPTVDIQGMPSVENPPCPQLVASSTVKGDRTTGTLEEPAQVATPGPRSSCQKHSAHLPLTPPPQLSPATERHVLKDITTSSTAQVTTTPSPAAFATRKAESCDTPEPDDSETPAPPATQPFRRYMVDSGKVVGVANTVARYRETKPVTARETPFNVRVLREMELEEQLLNHEEEAQAA